MATPSEMQATMAMIFWFSSLSLKAAETNKTDTGVKALILRSAEVSAEVSDERRGELRNSQGQRRGQHQRRVELRNRGGGEERAHLDERNGQAEVHPVGEDQRGGEEEADGYDLAKEHITVHLTCSAKKVSELGRYEC